MEDQKSLPRKSNVTISVQRGLNTAQYETLEVRVETTEEITWSDLTERAKKIENITKLLTDEYVRTQTKVLDELGIEQKPAWFKKTSRTVSTTPTKSKFDTNSFDGI